MPTTPWTEDRPDQAERYETATRAKNLTVSGGMVPKDHKSGQADVIAAAGMAGAFHDDRQALYYARRTGMALLRLHTEYASAAKPRKPRLPTLDELTATMPQVVLRVENGRSVRGPDVLGATKRLDRITKDSAGWYANELRLLAVRLKSRAYVLEQVMLWAEPKGISPQTVAEAVLYWLDPTCSVCSGHGFPKEPDKPVLSAKLCKECHGHGTARIADGAQVVVRYLEEAVQQGRAALRKRLRG